MATLTKKQLQIAKQTPPMDKITGSDFAALRNKGNDISKNMFVKNNGNSKTST